MSGIIKINIIWYKCVCVRVCVRVLSKYGHYEAELSLMGLW